MLFFRKYLPSFVLLITIMISGLYSSSAYAADYAWNNSFFSRFNYPSPSAVCHKIAGTSGPDYHAVLTSETSGKCYNSSTGATSSNLSIYRTGNSCPVGTTYNTSTGACESPTCPAPQFWDFETESCKYPEDELCPTGSNWDPVTQDCVCDGAGILSNSSGFRLCMQPADDSCSPESADFVGYINGSKPYCSGRARCASGSVPGTITTGGVTEYVCVPSPQDDPKCPNGTMGNFNGETVCIPKPNTDPNCPSGQSGTVDGQTVCIPKPGDPGGCAAGETAGFVGVGDQMNATCVPADYQPETCPAGQYAWNSETDGFACVTIPSTPSVGDDGGPTGPGQGGSGDNTATGTVVTKDAAGNVVETSEIELKLPDGLLQDQPKNDYFKETDEFGDSQLEKLDADTASILSEFTGADGAFTQRNSLESASDRLLGLFGYSTSCSGDLIFYQSENRTIKASCEKLNKMRELLGWFLYVSTLMGIYNILMQKQEN